MVEEQKYISVAALPNGNLVKDDAVIEASDCWYILRYSSLSKRNRDYLLQSPFQLYFPYRRVRYVDDESGKVDYIEQPSVPGYIFVHSTLEEAQQLGNEVGLFVWKKRGVDLQDVTSFKDSNFEDYNSKTPQELIETNYQRYYSIPDDAMSQFIRAVELNAQDFKLLTSDCIDFEKDDFVEINAGEYKGYRGYLKSVNGSNGGLVVIPLLDDEPKKDSKGRKKGNSKKMQGYRSLLHYGIPAQSSQVSILSFAKGSRRATDQISHAAKVVDRVMEAYVGGEKMEGQQTTRLLGYVHRFRQVEMETSVQRARLAILLYRIYTILELHTELEPVRQQLEDVILPEWKQRMLKVSRRDRPSAERTFQGFLAKKQEADGAYAQRLKAMAEAEKERLRR